MSAEQVIADELQAGYGDATQTVLDRQVARRVERSLLEAGWLSPEQAAILVASAGGRIEIDPKFVMSPPRGIRSWYAPDTMTTIVEAV